MFPPVSRWAQHRIRVGACTHTHLQSKTLYNMSSSGTECTRGQKTGRNPDNLPAAGSCAAILSPARSWVGTRFHIHSKFKFREKIDYSADPWGRARGRRESLTGVPLRRDVELERGQHHLLKREALVRVPCCNHEPAQGNWTFKLPTMITQNYLAQFELCIRMYGNLRICVEC